MGSDVPTSWNSTISMVTRLLAESWPLIVTLSDPTVTHSGKQYLDLRADQITVYWSGESYVTVSALLPLAREQLKFTHTTDDTDPVQAFQEAAVEKTTEHWCGEVTVTDDDPSKQIITATLDSRFQKLKFLTPVDRFGVQNKV